MLNDWTRFAWRWLLLVAVGIAIPAAGYPERKTANASSAQVTVSGASESASSALDIFEAWTKLFSDIAEVSLLAWGVWKYTRSVRTRHAEWLVSLFNSFYQTNKYKQIRTILDWPDSPAFATLRSDVEKINNSENLERLDLYLNFFEFVAVLWHRDQLKRDEVLDLFEYYLRILIHQEFLRSYIAKQGFERLDELLTTIK